MPLERVERLTVREGEVLRLLALGRSSGAIARVLGVSVEDARLHREHVRQKLAAQAPDELVVFVHKERLDVPQLEALALLAEVDVDVVRRVVAAMRSVTVVRV